MSRYKCEKINYIKSETIATILRTLT